MAPRPDGPATIPEPPAVEGTVELPGMGIGERPAGAGAAEVICCVGMGARPAGAGAAEVICCVGMGARPAGAAVEAGAAVARVPEPIRGARPEDAGAPVFCGRAVVATACGAVRGVGCATFLGVTLAGTAGFAGAVAAGVLTAFFALGGGVGVVGLVVSWAAA